MTVEMTAALQVQVTESSPTSAHEPWREGVGLVQ